MSATAEPASHNPNERLVLFSDAVIAITITLLALEIRLPEGFGEYGDAELWAALVALWPRFLGYLISFAVIGVFWINHQAKFSCIVKSDRGLLWVNLLFLLFIGIVPFTTSVVAENGGAVATAVYASGMVACGLSLAAVWVYADRRGLIDPAVSRQDRSRQLLSALLSSAVFAISVPFAFAHPDVAKFVWLLLLPIRLVQQLLFPAKARAKP